MPKVRNRRSKQGDLRIFATARCTCVTWALSAAERDGVITQHLTRESTEGGRPGGIISLSRIELNYKLSKNRVAQHITFKQLHLIDRVSIGLMLPDIYVTNSF